MRKAFLYIYLHCFPALGPAVDPAVTCFQLQKESKDLGLSSLLILEHVPLCNLL